VTATAPTAGAGDRAQARRGHLAMLAFSIVVAGSFTAGGLIANDIAPAAVNAMRFASAAVLLMLTSLMLASAGGPRGPRASDLAAPWRYGVLGSLFAFYFVLMFEGLKTAPPVTIGVVFTLTPPLTALAAWVILRQRLRGDLALALAVGAAGAVWVIFRGDPARLLALQVGRGEAIYLAGCMLHAILTPLMRRWNRGEPPLVSTALMMGAGFAVLVVYGWSDLMATDLAALPGRFWLALGYLVVFASAVAILLLQYGNQRLPASKVMAYSYLTPAWVLVIDLALGRGLPGLAVLPGIGLILLTQILLLRED
jgi:drug/metabolite transporter (DMT)-like permease